MQQHDQTIAFQGVLDGANLFEEIQGLLALISGME